MKLFWRAISVMSVIGFAMAIFDVTTGNELEWDQRALVLTSLVALGAWCNWIWWVNTK